MFVIGPETAASMVAEAAKADAFFPCLTFRPAVEPDRSAVYVMQDFHGSRLRVHPSLARGESLDAAGAPTRSLAAVVLTLEALRTSKALPDEDYYALVGSVAAYFALQSKAAFQEAFAYAYRRNPSLGERTSKPVESRKVLRGSDRCAVVLPREVPAVMVLVNERAPEGPTTWPFHAGGATSLRARAL